MDTTSSIDWDEYKRLRDAHDEALFQQQKYGRESDDASEQRTWDALIDFVEAHDLTYTEHDPRGEE